ncbi:hypothetical protein FRB98_005238 [Tulasnella sp. 332]|nr:hypothetical protein FRB98_005238 [Tulasnella sp. 332]
MKRGILKLLSSHSKDEPVLGREIVNLGAKADASAEDLLKGFQPLGSFKKLPEGYIGVTTVIGNDGSRQVEYSPERLGKQINYRLTSNSDGHYVLEWRQNDWPKGPASDWQILKTGGKGTASAEKSAVKALLKTDETPKVDQLKRVFTSMRDVHGSGDHYFQT